MADCFDSDGPSVPHKGGSMRKKLLIAFVILFAVLLAGAAGGFFYEKQHLTYRVNGTEMERDEVDSYVRSLAGEYTGRQVVLTENGNSELSGTLSDFGYTIDADAMVKDAEDQIAAQTGGFFQLLGSMAKGVSITVHTEDDFDEAVFAAFVKSASFTTPRVAASDGSVSYDESSKAYVVTESQKGNEIDDAKLQESVKASLQAELEKSADGSITIALPDTVYKEVDTSVQRSAEDLKAEADALNAYASSVVDYTFGTEHVTLDSTTFHSWLSYADGTVTVDEQSVKDYVLSLVSKYDTRYLTRTFKTTAGATITIDASHNEYGYTIDQSAEIETLKENLASGTTTTREPVYKSKNSYGNPVYLSRNGADDLAGTYVEIDLTKQHLWFYKDGALVIESDIVSGNVSTNHSTITGAYPLAFKESPSLLSSDVNGYAVTVNYWMPFYDGQGLHDASWRSSFGGTIYQTDGSHGCVNLPETVAAAIYNNITSGTAIILYQS